LVGYIRLGISVTRNIMMVRIRIPGAPDRFRHINVYNTHLCAGGSSSAEVAGIVINSSGCTVSARKRQLVKLLEFTRETARFFPSSARIRMFWERF